MTRRQGALAPLLMLASGFAGLGYQMVWTRQCALWLGHELPAVLAVVTAFFGGLALGAWWLGERIERSPRPGRWYAGCEAVIGLWGLVLVGLMEPASSLLQQWTGTQAGAPLQWALAFGGVGLLLLPATAAMGATLPAMERALREGPGRNGPGIAGLYALNTAGALLGVLGTSFGTIPAWGLSATALLCALLNLACAGLAWRVLPLLPTGTVPAGSPAPLQRSRGGLTALAWSGLLGIAYEVLVVRVLSQVAENTVYTFTLLLAVYLVGTALGAALYRRRPQAPAWAVSLACLTGSASLWWAHELQAAVQTVLGPGLGPALLGEAALATVAFGPPTVAMGLLFSHLCHQARQQGQGLGRSLAWNTLGGAIAPAAAGLVLVPALGAKVSLLAVSLGYLVLPTGRHRAAGALAPFAAATALALAAPPLQFIDVPAGGRWVDHIEGSRGSVSVVQDARGTLSLHIDNRQQEGSSATRWADARQALLPMLLHPAPRQALFLGLGTGLTATAATLDPALQADVVELLPEVASAVHWFVDPWPARLTLHTGDARRFVRAPGPAYDLIVADNFHPARAGAGTLYTLEHFRAVRGRLAPGGLFCQWLPLHQLDLDTLRTIVRTFQAVYPQAQAVLATLSLDTPVLGLLGWQAAPGPALHAVRQRLAQAAHWPEPAALFGFEDEWAVLGSVIAGPAALRAFAGAAVLNTDDHPVVAYRAPRITYAPDSRPRDRLLTLLAALHAAPWAAPGALDDVASAARLQAYGAARDRFLQAGRDVQPSADPQRMLAQVEAPLLDVLRLSPDFRPAYGPLLQLALAEPDLQGSTRLLQRLQQVRALPPEAASRLRAQQAAALTR